MHEVAAELGGDPCRQVFVLGDRVDFLEGELSAMQSSNVSIASTFRENALRFFRRNQP